MMTINYGQRDRTIPTVRIEASEENKYCMTIDDCFLFHFEVQQALIDDIEHRMDGCLLVDSPQIVGGCWVMIRFLRHFLHSNESIVLEQNNRLLIVLDWRHIPSLST